ncbi:ATP-binding protein [Kribbella antibiotica]|uniref:ATP-binding protein n=1 Tax=Kribbella antibiotica TaxID=190195 RepID=A0A4R4YGW1_9ACTN|nr:ATP-binding protein [Kribbella antibiotica]TDD44023.1 ATP-binding protein [Kribbella antibiotica]
MPLFYVAGASGSGKTTVGAELRRRGYPTYDVDVDRLGVWDGDVYTLPVETVQKLVAEVGDAVGFVTGSVGNEGEIWDLFTHVISLSADADTIRHRIAQRPNGFGSTEEELASILAWHATIDVDNARFGATLVDASPPVAAVADEVLRVVQR